MNKIFKVIWNHATQSWVAVSEFTKAHGKTKSVKLSAVATAIAAAATVGGTAHAAVSIGSTTGTTIATQAGAVSAGISIGEGASSETANDIAIGPGATVDRGDPGAPTGSIVIGNKAESTGQFGDIVIGSYSKTGTALGHPGKPSQITVIGSRSFAYGNQASVLSSDAVATGSSSIAMGGDDINDAREALDRDVAEFTAANNKAIKNNYEYIWGLVDPALTDRLKNTKIDMAGYGGVNPELKDTAAANLNNTHFLRTWAAGDASIALGYAAQTLGTGSHAIGVNSVAYSTASNAIGLLARAGDKTNVAGSGNANAFGTAAVAAAKDANAFGHNATVKSGAVGAIAFGVNASATAASNVVIGSNSNELSSTNAVGGQGNKIDSGTVGGVPYSGFAGEDKLVGVVSVGNREQTRQIINVAPGAITAESTDAINGSQLYQVLKPINFKANSNQDAAVTEPAPTAADSKATKQVFAAGDGAQIPLDKTLNIVGATTAPLTSLAKSNDTAVTGTYSAKNIQTVVTANDELQIQMAENPEFTSAKIGGVPNPADAANPTKAPITIGTVGTGPDAKNEISGLDSTLPETLNGAAPTKKQDAPALTDADKTKAATLGDVLNAGWNLQNNGTEKDFVKPYDTVNFIDGKGTKAVVDVKEDGTLANVTFNVDVTQLSAPVSNLAEGDKAGSLVGPADAPALTEALKNAEEALKALPQDATPEARKEAEDKVAAANNAITNAGNQLATAQNVANSVNNSFWKLNTSQDSANEAKVGDGKVNPSNDVVFNGVGAVKVSSKTAGTEESKYVIDIALDTAALSAVETPDTNTNTGEVKSPVEAAQEALDAAKQELADLPADAPEDVRKAAEEKVAAAQNALNNAPNALATAANVANAINNSGWNVTSGTVGSGARDGDAETVELINPSETVTFNAGDNLVIKQKGNEFTYSLNKDININSAKIGGVPNPADAANPTKAPITIGTTGTGPNAKNEISGLDSTLPETLNGAAPTTAQAAPTLAPADLTKAATLGDVLNAGWNLQNNDVAKDFVKPYDTVNFIDGQGTKAVVNVRENGTIADVKFDVDVTQLSAPVSNLAEGDKAGSLVGPADAPELAEALKNAEEALAALPQDATPEARKEAEDKVAAAKDAITNAGNQLATAQNVANSVNNSFWKLNTSQDSANEAKVGDGKVNPSNDVVFNGVGAVKVSSKTAGTEESKYIIDIALDTAALSAVEAPNTNTNTGEVKSPVEAAQEALDAAKQELADLPADAPEDVRKAAEEKVAAAQNALNNAPNALATAANVANAINNSGWNVTSGTVGSGAREGDAETVELINPSETVTFNAGDNLVIKQEGNEFTYSLNKDIKVDSVTANQAFFGGSPETEDAPAKAPIIIGTTPAGKNVVSNLDTTIAAPTTANNPADKPTEAQQSNAATLGDVLNAGWNLQENGKAKDVVTPYDTVNFVDGQGTTVKIDTTNGTVSNVTVNVKVDGSTIKFDDNGNLTAVQPDTEVNGNKVGGNINLVDSDTVSVAPVTDDKGDPTGGIQFNVNTASITPVTEGDKAGSVTGPVTPALTDALKAAQDELAALPADASEEAKQAAADKVAAAQNAVNKAGNAIATAQNVADAINASGWNATSGKVGTGDVKGTTNELINPSETVTFQAGDNMMLKQEGNVFTYSVNPNPVFNNVTAEAGVTIGKGDQAVNMTPIAPVNVLDKDGNNAGNNTAPAVNMNGATFTGLAPNLPVTSSVQDGDISPTTSQTIDPSKVNQSNAATLGDVLNAGWNLQANDKAVDFVRPYDTVNFKDSDSIKVSVAEDSTAAKTTLTLEANTSPLVMNGATADNEGGNGTVATPTTPAALATSGDVAKAINNSGFDLDVGSDTTTNGQVTSNDATAARVNPGKKVTVNAGRNIEVSRKGSDITVATSNDPVFNTVKVGGDDGVQLSASTGRDGVKELSVGSANAPTRITNVAKGVAPTDAVNVAQLKDEIGAAVAPIHNRINKVNKDLRAGIAGANAAAGLPQVYIPGKSMVAASAGTFKGQSAVAVGYSRASDNGKLILKLQGNANTRGDVGGSVGVGYQW